MALEGCCRRGHIGARSRLKAPAAAREKDHRVAIARRSGGLAGRTISFEIHGARRLQDPRLAARRGSTTRSAGRTTASRASTTRTAAAASAADFDRVQQAWEALREPAARQQHDARLRDAELLEAGARAAASRTSTSPTWRRRRRRPAARSGGATAAAATSLWRRPTTSTPAASSRAAAARSRFGRGGARRRPRTRSRSRRDNATFI